MFLKWSIHKNDAQIKAEMFAWAEQFNGRYQDRILHKIQWLWGEISDEDYKSKVYHRYESKIFKEDDFALRADLLGKHQEALEHYKGINYAYDSDKQLFTKWRIQSLESLLND